MARFSALSSELIAYIGWFTLPQVLPKYNTRQQCYLLNDDQLVENHSELAEPPQCLSFLPESEPEVDGGLTLDRVCHPQPGALSGRAQTCTFAPNKTPCAISYPFPLYHTCRQARAAMQAWPPVSHCIAWLYPDSFLRGPPRPVTATEYPYDVIASKPLCSCALEHVVQTARRCRVLDVNLPGRGGHTPDSILSAFHTVDECILEHLLLRFDAWTLRRDDVRLHILELPTIRSSRTLNSSFIVCGEGLTVLHVAAQHSTLRVTFEMLFTALRRASRLQELVLQSALKGPVGSLSNPITLPHLTHFYLQDWSECWQLLRQMLHIPETCPSVHVELVFVPALDALNMTAWKQLCNTLRAHQLVPPFPPTVGMVDVTRDALDIPDIERGDRRWPELIRFTVSDTYEGALACTDCRSSKPRWSIAIRNGLITSQGSFAREHRAQFEPPALEDLVTSLMRAMRPASAEVEIFSIYSRLDRWYPDLPSRWLEILGAMGNVTTIVAYDITDGKSRPLRVLAEQIGRIYNKKGELYLHPLSRNVTQVIVPDWTSAEDLQVKWNSLMRFYHRPPGHFPVRCAKTFAQPVSDDPL